MWRARSSPIADIETIETELMLADLDSLEKARRPRAKKAKRGDKDAKAQLVALLERALSQLREGQPVRSVGQDAEEDGESSARSGS